MSDEHYYSRQYSHSFKIGAILQIAFLALWVITESMVYGLLSAVNVAAVLFVYPVVLTWLVENDIDLWRTIQTLSFRR